MNGWRFSRRQQGQRPWLNGAATTALLAIGTLWVSTGLPSTAQTPDRPDPAAPLQISPQVLATIREAPFSELFSVNDNAAFGVKDKDYDPGEPSIGFFSLWANVPAWERMELISRYCVEDTQIARHRASLAEVTLMDGDTILVVLDQVIEASNAELNQIQPPRVSTAAPIVYYDPFYDPYWSSAFSYGVSYSPPVQLPAVDCSAGTARFNLMPVRQQLAQLPDKTLTVRLLFSDGNTQYWRLGRGTVSAIQELPDVKSALSVSEANQ